MGQEVLIKGKSYMVEQLLRTQDGQQTLAGAKDNESPILCLCCQAKPRLHTMHRGSNWYLSRFPGDGPQHHPSCDDYEDPDHAACDRDKRSSASAILPVGGVVDASLNLPLSSFANRPLDPSIGHGLRAHEQDGRRRTTLYGLLVYLYQQAGLCTWNPHQPRNLAWTAAAGCIARVCAGVQVTGMPLENRLILPRLNNQQDIAETLASFWQQPNSLVHRYLLVIGEVHAIDSACPGPDAQIFLEYWRHAFHVKKTVLEAAIRHKTYSNLRGALDDIGQPGSKSRVLVIGRVEVPPNGKPRLLNLAFMVVSAMLIPVQSSYELHFVNQAVAQGRSFLKPMMAVAEYPFVPDAVLTDTVTPCPCEIFGMTNDPAYDAQVEKKLREYPNYFQHPVWVWDPRSGETMPPLPERANKKSADD